MKIAHIADVHIRNVHRHKEYKEIFDQLCSQLKKLEVDLIYVAGDTFHSKTVTSPESTILGHDFYTSLANIADTVIIDGNHDLNLNNKERLSCNEAILSIIKGTKFDIKLLKKSGIYKASKNENIYFGVFSITDKKNWPIHIDKDKYTPDSIFIALFHGPINTSKLSDDYVLTTSFELSMFSEYDFGFLGDIHSRQGFKSRKHKLVNELTVKHDTVYDYSGSLIQQDFSEDLEKGFIVWDIKSRNRFEKTFYRIYNKFGFYTAKLKDYSEFSISTFVDVPKKSYFRLLFDEKLTDFHKQSVIEKISKQFDTINIFIIDGKRQSKNEAAIKNIQLITEINSLDAQQKLISDYIKIKSPEASIKDINYILDIHSSYYEQLKNQGIVSNQKVKKWKINNIKFSSLFRYGKNNTIDFDKMPGIIGVFGGNGCGKTSIIEIILWTIYNKTPRKHIKNEDILNVYSDHGISQLTLSHGTDKYIITREIYKKVNKKNNKPYYTNTVDIVRIDSSGYKHHEADESRTATDTDIIRPRFGDITDALLSSFASQFGHRQMIEMDNSVRKTTISKFLGIDIIQDIYEIANKDLNKYRNKFDLASASDVVDEIQKNKAQYNSLFNDIKITKKSIDKVVTKKNKLLERYNEYDSKIKEFNDKLNEKEIKTQKDRKLVVKKSIISIDTELNNLTKKQHSVKAKLESVKKEILDNFEDIYAILERGESDLKKYNELQHIKDQLVKLENNKDFSNSNIKYFVENKNNFIGNICTECKFFKDCLTTVEQSGNITNETYDDILEKLSYKTKQILDDIHLKKLTIKKLESEIIISPEQYALAQNLNKEKIFLQKEIDYISATMQDKSSFLSSLNLEFKAIEDYLHENSMLLAEADSIDKLSLECDRLYSEIEKHNNSCNLLRDALDVLKNNLSKTEGILEVLIKKQTDLNQISEHIRRYEYYISALHRDGIQSEIIKIVLPYINNEMQDIMTTYSCNFIVDTEYDEDTQNINFHMYNAPNKSDRKKLEMASGGEQILTSVVMRIAFSNVSSVPSSDFFVIDEGLAALDSNNITSVTKLFDILRNNYKHVLIISHMDSIQDMVEFQIPIKDIVKYDDDGAEMHFSQVRQ
jgi:DNA repair exonuclease SbcCD nuclease subunit/ABC-type lipopolysaccharide export system ATPase subunit